MMNVYFIRLLKIEKVEYITVVRLHGNARGIRSRRGSNEPAWLRLEITRNRNEISVDQ